MRVRVEEPDARERHGARGDGDERSDSSAGRLRRHRLRLCVLDLLPVRRVSLGQPGDAEGHGEEFVVRVRPHRQRRGADAGDRPQRDRLPCRAGADVQVGELGRARFAAGQQIERLVGPRQQRLQEPRGRVDRCRLATRRTPGPSRPPIRRRPGSSTLPLPALT